MAHPWPNDLPGKPLLSLVEVCGLLSKYVGNDETPGFVQTRHDTHACAASGWFLEELEAVGTGVGGKWQDTIRIPALDHVHSNIDPYVRLLYPTSARGFDRCTRYDRRWPGSV